MLGTTRSSYLHCDIQHQPTRLMLEHSSAPSTSRFLSSNSAVFNLLRGPWLERHVSYIHDFTNQSNLPVDAFSPPPLEPFWIGAISTTTRSKTHQLPRLPSPSPRPWRPKPPSPPSTTPCDSLIYQAPSANVCRLFHAPSSILQASTEDHRARNLPLGRTFLFRRFQPSQNPLRDAIVVSLSPWLR